MEQNMSSVQNKTKRHTLHSLQAMKGKERLAALTAYDVMTAQCLDDAGVDILLVGDSIGNVVYGQENTLQVRLDTIIEHSAAVVRGSERAFVIADLPFMSYQSSVETGLISSGRCLGEGGVQAVKMEGASPHILELTRRCVETGIPVMGHIGLTPQSIHQMGGFYIHGKTEKDVDLLVQSALALEKAGCFSLVLECLHPTAAEQITQELKIPTIGIGAGTVCDGEVLVVNDILGYTFGPTPKFATPYCNLKKIVSGAASDYVKQVKG